MPTSTTTNHNEVFVPGKRIGAPLSTAPELQAVLNSIALKIKQILIAILIGAKGSLVT